MNKQGVYELSNFDLTNHFDDDMVMIEKYNPEKVFAVIYLEGKSGAHYLKRFTFENTSLGKKTSVITEDNGSKLILITGTSKPVVKVDLLKGKTKTPDSQDIDLVETIEVKGMKAMGNRLSPHEVTSVTLLETAVEEEEEVIIPEEEEVQEEPGVHTATPVSTLAADIKDDDLPPVNEPVAQEPVVQDSMTQEPATPAAEEVEVTQNAATDIPVKKPEEPKTAKKVDFEITNPDDLDIDDKGQLGLF